MKKLILTLLAVASVGMANAQKNTILAIGNAGVFYNKNDNGAAGVDKTTTWNVTPGIGYQFSKCLTVGIEGSYFESKNTSTIPTSATPPIITLNNTNRSREWQLGAFFRHTMPLGGIFFAYHQLDVTYINGFGETQSTSITPLGTVITSGSDSYNGFQAMLTPAIGINVHSGVAINFSIGGIGYRMVNYDKAPTTTSSFYATMGNTFNFGITRNIGCGHHKAHGHHDPGMEHRKMKKHDADDDDE